MTDALIEIQGLTKRYGDFTAVDHLDLQIQEGEVFGFLGPNGSGKSTTILMLLGLTEPSEGHAQVCGFDPTREPLQVKRQVGYLPESVGFYNDLTGRENLLYMASLNKISRSAAEHKAAEFLEMVDLKVAANQLVGQYSRGMKQRLGLAEVLMKDPRLVILDDPTLGLDPAGVQWLLQLIQEMSSQRQIAVFISSHQLQEVQRICNRVGIMSHGKMVLEGTVNDLMSQRESGAYLLELEVNGGDGLSDVVRAIPGVQHCEAQGSRLVVEANTDVRPLVVAAVAEHGASLLELRSHNNTLEDIYLRYFQEN
jgi:ABC-2 type transport system ATP-binding protein